MGVGLGSHRMSPHESPARKLVGGTVGGDGAMFDVLGPVPLSSLAVPVPCALIYPAPGAPDALEMAWALPSSLPGGPQLGWLPWSLWKPCLRAGRASPLIGL